MHIRTLRDSTGTAVYLKKLCIGTLSITVYVVCTQASLKFYCTNSVILQMTSMLVAIFKIKSLAVSEPQPPLCQVQPWAS